MCIYIYNIMNVCFVSMFDLTFLAGSQEVLSGPLEEGHWDSREWRERGSSGGGQAGSRARTTPVLRSWDTIFASPAPMGWYGAFNQPCSSAGRNWRAGAPGLPSLCCGCRCWWHLRPYRWPERTDGTGSLAGRVRVKFGFLASVWMFPKIGVYGIPPKWMVYNGKPY